MLRCAITALALLLVAGCAKREIPSSAPRPTLSGLVRVQGKSMLPTFPEHAYVQVEIGTTFDELRAGDTVIFWDYRRGDNAFAHHRLVQKQGDAWIARGDNNSAADQSWVTRDNFYVRTTGEWWPFL